ncbi:hypothetical protein AS029_07785 [Microbacterium enclense]|nr:hypothetical protein AS029_07785 [Microbacterium enclense]
MMLGSLTTDLYLPAFPAITSELGTSRELVQLTVAASLIGVAAGQLIGGAWSDVIGRRVPLLAGTAVHVAASIGIALSADIGQLLTLRVVQGAGAAAASVVAMAIARDVVSGAPLVRLLARLALFSGLAPVVAPFLGSLLLYAFDWRGLFAVLGAYGVAVAVLCLIALPETRRAAPKPEPALQRYRAVLTDRVFLGAVILGAMGCTAVFSYVAASSFIFQDVHQLSSQVYAAVFAVNAAAFAIGSQVASRVVTRTTPGTALGIALPVWLAAGGALVVVDLTHANWVWLTVASFAFLAAAGMAMPVAQVLGMSTHGDRAGTAAAVLGAANFAVAGLVSPLAAVAAPTPQAALGIAVMVTATIAICACLLLRSRLTSASDRSDAVAA